MGGKSRAIRPTFRVALKAGAHAKAPRRKGAELGGRAVSGNAAGITCGPEGKARAEALRRREMTPKSVAAAVDPSPLDAPIGICNRYRYRYRYRTSLFDSLPLPLPHDS